MNRYSGVDPGTSLAALGLRPALVEALRARGLWRVEDLACVGRSCVAGLRGAGTKTLAALDAALRASGLTWRSAREAGRNGHGDGHPDAA